MSKKMNSDQWMLHCKKLDYNGNICKSAINSGMLTSRQIMKLCRNNCFDIELFNTATKSGKLDAKQCIKLYEESGRDSDICMAIARSGILQKEHWDTILKNTNHIKHACISVFYTGLFNSKNILEICKIVNFDWKVCAAAVKSNMLNVKQVMYLCEKTVWDWDVCNAAIQTGILGRQELIKILKNKQNINVVYALKSLGCSYSDVEKYMKTDLKFSVDQSTVFLTSEQIREKISATGLYDTSNTNYFIAYKGVMKNRQSSFARKSTYYNYQDGLDYRAFANCDPFEQNSYGLSVWTEEAARNYESGTVLKVLVPYYSVAAIVHKNNKIRVRNLHVMHAVGAEKEFAKRLVAKKSEIRARINWYRENKNQKII